MMTKQQRVLRLKRIKRDLEDVRKIYVDRRTATPRVLAQAVAIGTVEIIIDDLLRSEAPKKGVVT